MMKRLGLILGLALGLGACSTLTQLQQVAGTAVTPTQAIIAANAFDAIEAGATGYLTFCKANPTSTSCTKTIISSVVQYVRAGRAARNQMETYIQTSATIPTAVYNSVVAAVNNLKATPAATFVGG